jgi:hypothetical protein
MCKLKDWVAMSLLISVLRIGASEQSHIEST